MTKAMKLVLPLLLANLGHGFPSLNQFQPNSLAEEEAYFTKLCLKGYKNYDYTNESSTPDFIPWYRNPCWLDCLNTSNVFNPESLLLGKPPKRSMWRNMMQDMTELYQQRIDERKPFRIRCVPAFYIPGVVKCGTTDLFKMLIKHPFIYGPKKRTVKEYRYWANIRYRKGEVAVPVKEYVDVFDQFAEYSKNTIETTDNGIYHPLVISDASPGTLTRILNPLPSEEVVGRMFPRQQTAELIHKLTPQAKLIVILRNPTDMVYSAYKYFSPWTLYTSDQLSPEDFHEKVVAALDRMTDCAGSKLPLITCYSNISHNQYNDLVSIISRGMYYIHLRMWLSVFSQEQLLVLRTEEYHEKRQENLNHVYEFLGFNYAETYEQSQVEQLHRQDFVFMKSKKTLGKMFNVTRILLNTFFQPYNENLAFLLNDKGYLWK